MHETVSFFFLPRLYFFSYFHRNTNLSKYSQFINKLHKVSFSSLMNEYLNVFTNTIQSIKFE